MNEATGKPRLAECRSRTRLTPCLACEPVKLDLCTSGLSFYKGPKAKINSKHGKVQKEKGPEDRRSERTCIKGIDFHFTWPSADF